MKNHSLVYFFIFTSALVIGYTLSTRYYYPDLNSPSPSSVAAPLSVSSPLPALNNGQRSILLISTESIQATRPQLEGVWLVTYIPSGTTIQLLPIFPTGKSSSSDFEQQLIHAFSLNQKNSVTTIDPEFKEVLENRNFWWSAYIIFDQVALSEMINLLGGIELGGITLDGAQVIAELPETAENSSEAYSIQAAILQSACHKLSDITPEHEISTWQSLLPHHILTDLDSGQLQAEIQSFYGINQAPTCRFPMLEISRTTP